MKGGGQYDGKGQSAAAALAAHITRDHRDLLRFMYQTSAKGKGKTYHQWSEEWKSSMAKSRTVHANALEGEWESRTTPQNTKEWRWVPKDEFEDDWQQWSWGRNEGWSAWKDSDGRAVDWSRSPYGNDPLYVTPSSGLSEKDWADAEAWAKELETEAVMGGQDNEPEVSEQLAAAACKAKAKPATESNDAS